MTVVGPSGGTGRVLASAAGSVSALDSALDELLELSAVVEEPSGSAAPGSAVSLPQPASIVTAKPATASSLRDVPVQLAALDDRPPVADASVGVERVRHRGQHRRHGRPERAVAVGVALEVLRHAAVLRT